MMDSDRWQAVAALFTIFGSICMIVAVILSMYGEWCYVSLGMGIAGVLALLVGIRINMTAAARIKRRGHR